MPVPAHALNTFHSVIAEAQRRNAKRAHFAELIAVLLAILLWETKWLALRPGLVILLIGQLGVALVLILRNLRLSKDLERWSSSVEKDDLLAWFEAEGAFARRSTWFESGARLLGLIVVAYGFWAVTGNLWVALAIGVVYPVSLYFGMMRSSNAVTLQRLEKQRDEITWKL
jgi:hypothetical protein